jgi:NADP-dependent aldehyde dehydrogenase
MNDLRGTSIIGGEFAAPGPRSFEAVDPATGRTLEPGFHSASREDVERAVRLAAGAFDEYSRTAPENRAAFLRAIAEGLEETGEAIMNRANAEAAIPLPRLQGELARTANQLRLFATVVEEGSWVDARIDRGDAMRKPPKPDVRSMRRPLGPVVVFGASNFPIAFSTAGGDTASALAAGNPVIVKAHPAHPGTSELVGRVIVEAMRRTSIPLGVFALLFDDGIHIGQTLVQHPAIRAVGFTGSRRGGEALMRLAASRPDPIPVYAEMGSVNPVVILPGALRERATAIADGLHASYTAGVGQFCTNPGVILLGSGPEGDAFVEMLAERTRATAAAAMLTSAISSAYERGCAALRQRGAERVAEGRGGTFTACGRASLWQVDAVRVLEEPRILDEVFGPSTLIVRYQNLVELHSILRTFEGQLTATIHAGPDELEQRESLLHHLAPKVGRLIFNQFPTGVEVGPAMIHGGPFPATSDGQSTSVGTHAIERFTRYLAYQNFPDEAVPVELRSANPRRIWRMVEGERTRE